MMLVLVMTTAPFKASILPTALAPEFMVIEVRASTFPLKEVPSPIVAELPVCQKIFLACAPPVSIMLPPAPPTVVKPDAIWKIHTAFGSPCASSVKSPACTNKVEVDL